MARDGRDLRPKTPPVRPLSPCHCQVPGTTRAALAGFTMARPYMYDVAACTICWLLDDSWRWVCLLLVCFPRDCSCEDTCTYMHTDTRHDADKGRLSGSGISFAICTENYRRLDANLHLHFHPCHQSGLYKHMVLYISILQTCTPYST